MCMDSQKQDQWFGQKCDRVKVSLSVSSWKNIINFVLCFMNSVCESVHMLNYSFVLTCFFCPPVQTWIPDSVLLYLPHLPIRLEQIPQSGHLQMVHSSSLHARSGGAHCSDRAQAADPHALCGPQPHPHSKRLGEDGSRGEQEVTANIELGQIQTQHQKPRCKDTTPICSITR